VGLVRRLVDMIWVGAGLALVTLWPLQLQVVSRSR
jgi:hypothetical protein